MRILLSILSLILIMSAPAEAKRVRHVQAQAQTETSWFDPQIVIQPAQMQRSLKRHAREIQVAIGSMLPHPSGCPRSAFCGCGAAVDLGLDPSKHMMASSYYKYPRSSPASGMVGVRPHHVFVLKQHVGGNDWLVADYNSGGRQSRLHVRSISGYTIVNPHG